MQLISTAKAKVPAYQVKRKSGENAHRLIARIDDNLIKSHPELHLPESANMVGRFQDKVVIVTGSSNGIGRATAILFAEEGAKVTITGRDERALAVTQKEMQHVGAKKEHIVAVQGDLINEHIQKKLIDVTIETFGKLDILVNNAGGTAPSNTLTQGFDQSMEAYDYVMNLNTRVVLALTKRALPHLIASKGEIVMVSSIAGLPLAAPGFPYYSMSKGALDQLTRALAAKYILEGVRVNSVNPGMVATTIMQKQGLSEEQSRKAEIAVASNTAVVPAGRVGASRDIAEAIAFLADRRASSFIVGHSLVVDGGSSIVCPLFAMSMDERRN
ncbi:oxidoreductase, short chain dehydrogenase/reductase family protein [Teladorsagia circumcincta]|uniref:Oxidoreductase, short chain dehydrogenase/reductase family protein n=1 Tax=Teladorsagia circumcincta TaxID=45464 RepID=A0A2G9UX57_TELCI|nr:oxidoreductase, short chain dehydrogenase/reductase family protein [Teladorsagia circumcincta]